MWGSDRGDATQHVASGQRKRAASPSGGDTREGEWIEVLRRREPSDALDRVPGDDLDLDADVPEMSFPGAQSDVMTGARLREHNRALLREFLGSVPRAEPNATLALLRPDGTPQLFTRAEFTRVIDGLRPRMRQIMRLANEERWPRQRVCDYLNGISRTTFERDHAEAFSELLQYIEER